MKMIVLKNYFTLLSFLLVMFAAGCQKKNEVTTPATFSGTESKTWKAERETTASGDKDKITSTEKTQEMQFFANGSFSMRSSTQNVSGKWTYDAMGKNLALQFVGSDMTENFQVLSINDDEMKLQAADGSTMMLEAQ